MKCNVREVSLILLDLIENSTSAGAKRIKAEIKVNSRGLKLTVVDDGEGISKENLARIKRGERFSTKNSSGLGLSLLRDETRSSGGKLKVSSKPNKGTKVVATFKEVSKIGKLGDSVAAIIDESYDVSLKVKIKGREMAFDTKSVKAKHKSVADMQYSGAIREIREKINTNLSFIGGELI